MLRGTLWVAALSARVVKLTVPFLQVRSHVALSVEAENAAPEEFLCAISLSLMEDPVALPSGHVVDRGSIERVLLMEGGTNPFTRLPLALDDLVARSDLRDRIAEWRRSVRPPSPGRRCDEEDRAA